MYIRRASLLMFSLLSLCLSACDNKKGKSCDPNKEENCECTFPSGENCAPTELYCQCLLVEDDDRSISDQMLSESDEGMVSDAGMMRDEGMMSDEGPMPELPCYNVVCLEGQICNELTGGCISEDIECPNECEMLGSQTCTDTGLISTCEAQDECNAFSTPVACPENQVCRGQGEEVGCVCAPGLLDDGNGGCVMPSPWSDDVILIEVNNEGIGEVSANFADGLSQDLGEWGTPNGSNCWPSSQRFNFWDGKPRFLALSEPVGAWKTVTITVTPSTMDMDPEIFAYLLPERFTTTPPATDHIGMCKTSFSASSLGNEGVAETITFNTYAALEPQNLVIGVANESSGEFQVRVEITDMNEQCFGDNGSPSAWPPYVETIQINQELDMYTSRGLARSSLEQGAPMCELDWVWEQFCDVTPQAVYYEGNHTLLAFDQPEYSLQVVTVTPDPGVEVTLWGYAQGLGNYRVPPAASGIACEVSHPTDRLNRPTNPGQAETIEFYAFNNAYNNLIGISGFGPDGQAGGFTVTVDQYLTAADACEDSDFAAVQNLESWNDGPRVNVITTENGEYNSNDDLAQGQALCGLSWMSNAYCVPDTQFHYFGGNHVFYALEEPLVPGEKVEIEVIPSLDAEVSLYGYLSNTTTYSIPPVVSSTMCEASHRYDLQHRPGYGEIERIEFVNPASNPNPYNVFFGVAGYTENWPPMPDDIGIGDRGAYTLNIKKTQAPPRHCEESLPGSSYAAWPSEVNTVSLNEQNQGFASGNLNTGRCMNLEFAEEIYCFPGTQNQHFEGNHVFYAVDRPMPPNSTMRITVTPDPDVEVSIYGYDMPVGSYAVPPVVSNAISCEASHTQNGIQHTPNPGVPEVIEFQNPTNNDYSVFFAVAGDNLTGTSGAYNIAVEMLVSEPHCEESLTGNSNNSAWPNSVNVLNLTNGEVEANGDLSNGSCMNLDFAEQAYCFPGTQNQHFQGNHVFYALDAPQPPNSVLTITVEPDPNVEVSLYGWQSSPSDFTVPPYTNSSVCEASHTQNGIQHEPNPGVPETIRFYNPGTNPNNYGIFFAVAGDRDTGMMGAYTVKVSLDVGETFCEDSLSRTSSSCWPSDVTEIPRGESSGNLNTGACTNLGWADNSSVACFPATESDMFDGNHVYFALAEPMGPNSTLNISATPNSSATDLSLYAFMIGANQCFVPPNVGAVVSCEASHASFNRTNPGEAESVVLTNPTGNSYNVVIGVAGASETTTGAFTLSVEEQ